MIPCMKIRLIGLILRHRSVRDAASPRGDCRDAFAKMFLRPGAGRCPVLGWVFRGHGGCEEVGEACGEGLEGFGALAVAAFAAEGEPLLLLGGEVGGGGREDGGQRG
jgi:hypothetical protein